MDSGTLSLHGLTPLAASEAAEIDGGVPLVVFLGVGLVVLAAGYYVGQQVNK